MISFERDVITQEGWEYVINLSCPKREKKKEMIIYEWREIVICSSYVKERERKFIQ